MQNATTAGESFSQARNWEVDKEELWGGTAPSILSDFGASTPTCQQTSRSIDSNHATNHLGKIPDLLGRILCAIPVSRLDESHHCNKTSPPQTQNDGCKKLIQCRAFFFRSFSLSLSMSVCSIISCRNVAKHSSEALSEASKQLDLVDQRGSAAGEPWSHLVTLY